MRKLRVVFLVLLGMSCLSVTAHGQLVLSEKPFNLNATTLVLGCDGGLAVNGGGTEMTTLQIKSERGLFKPNSLNEGVLPGLFDIIREDKLFKLDPGGFAEVDFGRILPNCNTVDVLIEDLSVSGSFVGGGDLTSRGGGGPYVYALPEPSSAALFGVGIVGLLGLRRQRRS